MSVLTLYAVYNKRAKTNIAHKLTKNSKFYQAHYEDGRLGYNFSTLNGLPVFSEQMILQEQKQRAKELILNNVYKPTLQELNNILNDNFSSFDFSNTLTAKLETIFQDFENGGIATMRKINTYGELQNHIQRHDSLISELTTIYDSLVKISGFNPSVPLPVLDRLNVLIQELKADIANCEQYPDDTPLPPGRSYLQKSVYLGYRLKGYLFEAEANDFIKSIPSIEYNNKKYLTVNLANTYIATLDLFGNNGNVGTKQARQDFGLIQEDLAKSVNISWTVDGQSYTGTIADFIQVCENKNNAQKTISIKDINDAQKIKDCIIGIQAKSNLGKIIFLNNSKQGKTISLSTVLDANGNPAQKILWKLWWLTTPYGDYQAHLEDTHDYYDAYFNYAIGKFLANIIGVENQIMVTRYGFQTVQDWLLTEIENQRYIRAMTRVHIRYPDTSIRVGLK